MGHVFEQSIKDFEKEKNSNLLPHEQEEKNCYLNGSNQKNNGQNNNAIQPENHE